MLGKLNKLLYKGEQNKKTQVTWMNEFKSVGMFLENQKISILTRSVTLRLQIYIIVITRKYIIVVNKHCILKTQH